MCTNKEEDKFGIDQHEAGAKMDKNKPDLSLLLLFGRAMEAVGELATFGAKKYSRGGFRKVPDAENRYTAALLRHLYKEDREYLDEETSLPHAVAVAWNALARLEAILESAENQCQTAYNQYEEYQKWLAGG